jgi:hypothetical protein
MRKKILCLHHKMQTGKKKKNYSCANKGFLYVKKNAAFTKTVIEYNICLFR